MSYFTEVNQYIFVINLILKYCQVKDIKHQERNIGLDGNILSGKIEVEKWLWFWWTIVQNRKVSFSVGHLFRILKGFPNVLLLYVTMVSEMLMKCVGDDWCDLSHFFYISNVCMDIKIRKISYFNFQEKLW